MSGVNEDQYFYPTSDAVEDVECYRPGGFYLVHLGTVSIMEDSG
jgi:hypothetical protein